MFSSSSPSNTTSSTNRYTTKTNNLNLQQLGKGTNVLIGNKAPITMTDNGAVNKALSTIEATNSQAFNFAQQVQSNVTAAQRLAVSSETNATTQALGFAQQAFSTAAASQRSDTANTMTTLIKYGAIASVILVVGLAMVHKHG